VFYGAKGEKLGTYQYQGNPGCGDPVCYGSFTPLTTSVWFTGRLIADSGNGIFQDRVGTNRFSGARYYPYGDEITSTSNDRVKFATYKRDSYTGLDYADQRFYASTYGRFNTPDPYMAKAKGANDPSTPLSWNRYAYVLGDPVNARDPQGLFALANPPDPDDGDGLSLWDIDIVDYGDGFNLVGGVGGLSIQPSGPSYTYTSTSGGSSPTSVNNVQPFSQNPWVGIAAAVGSSNSTCGNWLQTGFANSPYATQFQTVYQFLASTSGLGAYTSTANFVGGTASAVTSNTIASGNLVLINNFGAYFNPFAPGTTIGPTNNYSQQINQIQGGSPQAQAFILLHELGHVLNLLQPDATSTGAQASNNDLLWSNCGSVIRGY